MSKVKLAYILPSFRGFDYSRRCLLSLFKYTPDCVAVVIDDASPGFTDSFLEQPRQKGRVVFERFEKNRGLTAAWNRGLELARAEDPEYIVVGNHDVLFNNGWYDGMIKALTCGFHLVGPLSNAPGVTARGLQDIKHYVKNYTLSDEADYNNELANRLKDNYANRVIPSAINGFFMMARTTTWFGHMFDAKHVFRPVNKRSASGHRNPTPLMTGNEDELQARWRKKKLRSGVAISSFIFHYRSVARGKQHAMGRWMRLTNPDKEV